MGLLDETLTDELTGLPNRRYLNRRLPVELRKAEFSKKPFSLLFLDVDHFKEINDMYGHRTGDEALCKVTALLESSVRDTDIVLRFAGDEFAVFLPNTDNKTASEVARKIVDAISRSALEVLDKSVKVSISVGVATYPEDGENRISLFDFADKALYAVKKRGRNGVCCRIEVVEDARGQRTSFCPELVGRSEELSRMMGLLDLCLKGKGGMVFLSGEAGIGKTRLLKEFAELACRNGALILAGRCFGEPTSFPYQPFKDALSKYPESCRSAKQEIMQSIPNIYRNELINLIPELAGLEDERDPGMNLDPERERLSLFDAVCRFLIGISRENPLILALEDLHSLDATSCHLLHYLAQNLGDSSILVCGTFRSEELEVPNNGRKPLAKLLPAMRRDKLCSSIKLKRLSQKETAKMVRFILHTEEVPESFFKGIYSETEGNPFFVEEVIKSLIEAGKVSTKSDLDKIEFDKLEIPTAMKDLIQQKLNTLRPKIKKTLELASVIGSRFNFDLLHSASGLNEDHLLALIEEALRSQLIVEESEEQYSFSHGKIRQAICEGISKQRRKRFIDKLAVRAGSGS